MFNSKNLKKSLAVACLLVTSQVAFSEETNRGNIDNLTDLSYELKVGITPYESYGSSSYSERFDRGVDYGLEVYKEFEKYSFGFGAEVKRKTDEDLINGVNGRLYPYYFLAKRRIVDSYSLVGRFGRTSQKEFESKFYTALGIEKRFERFNVQLLVENTKLENDLNDKDYFAVGLKFGYVFGNRYTPVIEEPAPIIVEEPIPAPAPEPKKILVISGDQVSGGYEAYSTPVPESQIENVIAGVNSLNEYDQPGVLTFTVYSDNTGSKELNVELANERIKYLQEAFRSNGLTEKVRFVTIDPATTVQEVYKFSNDTFESRKQNRRIEVSFIED